MTIKPSDFNTDGEKGKSVGKAQFEAESAVNRMYNAVNGDRDAARLKANTPETADTIPTKAEVSPGESASFMTQKTPINYYEGKLSTGAGSTAETGLKGLFNIDRLNGMLSASNEKPNTYKSTRVDGLHPQKDALESSFKVPDFVPKFPST